MNARANRRYALQVPVELQGNGESRTVAGLLIELSLETARISQLGDAQYLPGERVVVETTCGRTLPARIRYAHEGIAGVQFENALHLPELSQWVTDYRNELAAA